MSIEQIPLIQIIIIHITYWHKNKKPRQKTMGINQSLCLNEDGSPTYLWCKYEVIDNSTIITEQIFACSLLVLAGIVSRYYYHLVRYRKEQQYQSIFGDVFVYVYNLIFGWLICSLLKVFINVGVYYGYMAQDFIFQQQRTGLYEQNTNPVSGSPIVILSSVFYFFDYMCPYLLLLLMVLIPYYWLKALLLSTNQTQVLSYETRTKIQTYFKILKIVKYHNKYFMPLFPILLAIQPFILYFTPHGCKMGRVNSYFIEVESLLILSFYLYGYVVVKFMRKNKLLNLSKADLTKIKVQYFSLVYVIVVRIVISYFFKLTNFYEYKPNKNCSNLDQSHSNKVGGVIALTIAQFIMHLMPISLILYVYRPNPEFISRDQMILKYGSIVARSHYKTGQYVQENVDNQHKLSLTEQLKK